jgi:AcrR family transcriptional regulator
VVETKRNIILEEASHIFESEGFNSVKMQDIANRLGISVGALYKLFDSKEALYYAYVEYQIRKFHEALVQACSGREEPRACLARYVRMKFDIFRAKRKAIEDPVVGDPLFFFKMNTHRSEPARPIFEYLAGLFAKLHEKEPLREDDTLKVAYLFNAFTTGYVEYWIHYGRGIEQSEESVLAEFLEGMKR